ncbi:hypothetical protein [Bacteroides mediterraneensis]|uniref:hypothetical protein n=1 Tax=Bacteroides mediterraneensis TaxID=1841856 RepID=UPI001EF5B7F9|nr:hypothetical protein [Bacteroides mediterraneensis]
MLNECKEVFHHLGRLIGFYPMVYQPLKKLSADLRVGKETSFNDISYAVLLQKVPELMLIHVVAGKEVVSFRNGKSVAGSDEYGIGLCEGLAGF